MARSPSPAELLAARFCRPQRIGVFGYRGVGKTTLLTVLYREAVGGRLPSLRLAAADARTAQHLSDKVLQLEAGQPLPGTLTQTDLRFIFITRPAGSWCCAITRESKRSSVATSRSVTSCGIVTHFGSASTPRVDAEGERLKRQQEVEQFLEAYLVRTELAAPTGKSAGRPLDRPVAIVFTKGDLLADNTLPDGLATDRFGMTRYALANHCHDSDQFVVRCLNTEGRLDPHNLDALLLWLATALQKQDAARLEQIWSTAGRDVGLLVRCVACFAQRYPDVPASTTYRRRLHELRRARGRRRILTAVTTAACLLAGWWTYDGSVRCTCAGSRSRGNSRASAARQPIPMPTRRRSGTRSGSSAGIPRSGSAR